MFASLADLTGTILGAVDEFLPSGNGTPLQSLTDNSNTKFPAGMTFDVAGNLYVTHFDLGTVSKFDKTGSVVNATFLSPKTDGQPSPESIRAVGNLANLSDLQLYVGGPGCACILVYNSAGTLVRKINVAPTGGYTKGTDWIEFLTPTILLYSGEGQDIKAFDILANSQLPDLIDNLPDGGFQFRVVHPSASCAQSCVLPDPYILVADSNQAVLLDPTPWLNTGGSMPALVTTTYPAAYINHALAVDPDGMHFWVGDFGFHQGHVSQINTCTGQLGYLWATPDPAWSVPALALWGGLGFVW